MYKDFSILHFFSCWTRALGVENVGKFLTDACVSAGDHVNATLLAGEVLLGQGRRRDKGRLREGSLGDELGHDVR